MSLAIVTSVYGDYDPLRPLKDTGFDEAICVTDNPDLQVEGWTMAVDPQQESPRLAAKRPKMMPWIYADCDSVVWIDASFSVSDGFSDWVKGHLVKDDFVVWRHPEGRFGIEQEVDVCWFFDKYRDQPMREQLAFYLSQGMPTEWGLFACGTIGYNVTGEVKEFAERWYEENRKWTLQDQVSLPYLLWDTGMPFGVWAANEYSNPYVQLRWDERPRPKD